MRLTTRSKQSWRSTAAIVLVALSCLAAVAQPAAAQDTPRDVEPVPTARDSFTPISSSCKQALGIEARRWPGDLPTLDVCVQPPAPAKPSAAVAMGDSFVSGEGAGEYDNVFDVILNQDQSFPGWTAYDREAYFCHRSSNASIQVADLDGIDDRFNIACSGAAPADFANPAHIRGCIDDPGKQCGRNVASQISQLEDIATTHDIELILIGVGSNNSAFTFGGSAGDCAGRFLADGYFDVAAFVDAIQVDPCTQAGLASASDLANGTAEATMAVLAVIDALEGIDDDYRIVLQDYTNPLPEQLHSTFNSEGGKTDTANLYRPLVRERYAAGCPIHVASLAPAHWFSGALGTMVDDVRDAVAQVHPDADIVRLNVQDAFDGDRLCEKAGSPNGAMAVPMWLHDDRDLGEPVTSLTGWGQLEVLSNLLPSCKDHFQTCQEAWHPSAAGHEVLGECLSAAWTTNTLSVDCNRAGGATTTILNPYLDLELINPRWDITSFGQWQLEADWAFTLENVATYSISNVVANGSGMATNVSTTVNSSSFYSGTVVASGPCTVMPNVSLQVTALVNGQTIGASEFFEEPQFPVGYYGC